MPHIALIQMNGLAKPSDNLDRAFDLIKKAAEKKAQIVCLQELFSSRYFCQTNNQEHFKLAEVIPGPTSQKLGELSKKLNIVLVASLYEKDGDDYYNTAIVINNDGALLGKYRKLHIPDDPNNYYSEAYYFKPGNLGTPVFETSVGKIGVLVCWDQWYPEPARALAEQGAQIIFYPTSIGWPTKDRGTHLGKKEFEAWVTIQRSHAIANGIFVASCNRVGVEDNLQFWGGSFICDTFGEILVQASQQKEEIVMMECDFSKIDEVRKDWPFLTCRRFKIGD